ncbi:MAG: RpiB/LacA/LacB family sugar-phosphate isomerase [Candidatus Diapherotrites archaeon]|nr:RpiB/LacA/LacB family sugar-phosphate isomerase [Candidatus Diapherotrites archaeon]
MIVLGADRHGFKAIGFVEGYLNARKFPFVNVGVKAEGENVNLEDLIPRAVDKVKENKANKGIFSCGTGVGVAVGANKFNGIRACLAVNEKMAEWSVVYDDCNVLCLAGWGVDKKTVFKILDSWFSAKYDGDKNRRKMLQHFDTWR